MRYKKDPKVPNEVLKINPPVPRDDGRFYVPVTMEIDRPGLSPIVLRVASDAFATVRDAEDFAQELCHRWNHQL